MLTLYMSYPRDRFKVGVHAYDGLGQFFTLSNAHPNVRVRERQHTHTHTHTHMHTDTRALDIKMIASVHAVTITTGSLSIGDEIASVTRWLIDAFGNVRDRQFANSESPRQTFLLIVLFISPDFRSLPHYHHRPSQLSFLHYHSCHNILQVSQIPLTNLQYFYALVSPQCQSSAITQLSSKTVRPLTSSLWSFYSSSSDYTTGTLLVFFCDCASS
jgi:hypothetical protein